MKTCRKCCESKELDQFGPDKRSPDGRKGVCRKCCCLVQCEWQRNNPEKLGIYHKRWKDKNVDRVRETNREWRRKFRKENPEIARQRQHESSLKKLYGIGVEWLNKKLAEQNSLCAICGQPSPNSRLLAVDHCHKTGKVRDLLCHHCNTLLHKMEQNIEWVRKAEAYLRRHDEDPDPPPSRSHEALWREHLL